MSKIQDDEAEMQMAMVRLCRVKNNANDVWSEMERLFPDYSLLQIRAAVRPLIVRMMQSLQSIVWVIKYEFHQASFLQTSVVSVQNHSRG